MLTQNKHTDKKQKSTCKKYFTPNFFGKDLVELFSVFLLQNQETLKYLINIADLLIQILLVHNHLKQIYSLITFFQ